MEKKNQKPIPINLNKKTRITWILVIDNHELSSLSLTIQSDLSPLSNIIGDYKPSPIKSDSNPASSNAVDDGLHLSKHLYFGKDPGESLHKPSSRKDKAVAGCAYLPTSPTVYDVISNPMIVENPDISSTSRTCTPPTSLSTIPMATRFHRR